MQTFGDYVATRELPAEPNVTVWRARKKQAPATEQLLRDDPRVLKSEKFVIKLRPSSASPERPVASGESIPAELEQDPQHDFLKSVSCQKKAHDAGARHIAPVYSSGRGPEGAWYVTDYCERGLLESWIKLLGGVTAEELHFFITSILQGLLELRRFCGRTHGDLRPGKMLVGGKVQTALHRTPIILLDPLPGHEANAPDFERADLRALGEIIFELVVCHGEIRRFNPADYPIEHSADWGRLGKHGKEWLEICNQLLDPGLSLDKISLEWLSGALAKCKPRPRVSVGVWAAIAAILALIAGGLFFFLTPRSSDLPVALSQKVETLADTPKTIILSGRDPLGRTLNYQVLDEPKNGDLRGSAPELIYLPKASFSGSDQFSFKVNNALKDSQRGVVTVLVKQPILPNQPPIAPNTPPTISRIEPQTTAENQAIGPLPFIVGDAQSPASALVVGPSSSNPVLIPDGNVVIGGGGSNRTVTVVPTPGRSGTAQIILVVSDGSLSTAMDFPVTVRPRAPLSPVVATQAVPPPLLSTPTVAPQRVSPTTIISTQPVSAITNSLK